MALLRAIDNFVMNQTESLTIRMRPISFSINRQVNRKVAFAGCCLLALFSRFAPGAQATLVTRARLVDDIATQLAKEGLKQIVVLGAGFDLMAVRRRYELQDVTIFELDHPATQAIKRSVISNWAPGNLPNDTG